MKILHYTTSLSRSGGGLYTALSGLAQAEHAQGANVRVIGWADDYYAEDASVWDGLDVLAIPARQGKCGYGLGISVFKVLHEYKPDIFHVHGVWSAGTIYGLAFALQGTQVVVSPHGMLDPWILSRSRVKKFFHSHLFEKPLMARSYVHFLNEKEHQAAAPFFSNETIAHSFIVPNGIFGSYGVSPEKMGCLFIGRLHEKKQVVELIQHWPKTDNFPLLSIAGWGEEGYMEQIREAIDEHENVMFVGSLYGDEKKQALAAAQFIILPSVSEGLPMAILEGLAQGCIPVITRECNLDELINDGVAIEIKSDFSDFQTVISEAFSVDCDELEKLSMRCRTYAKRYEWESVARNMLNNYEQVLKNATA